MKRLMLLGMMLCACGGSSFEGSGLVGAVEPGVDGGLGGAVADAGLGSGGSTGVDGGTDGAKTLGSGGAVASGGSSAGGSPSAGGSVSASSGGAQSAGGVIGAGGTVPQPACCVDTDCPATGVPFCSPWGTCYQGGDPYNCDYDNFCESFCVHCSGKVSGACEPALVQGRTVKRCVCS